MKKADKLFQEIERRLERFSDIEHLIIQKDIEIATLELELALQKKFYARLRESYLNMMSLNSRKTMLGLSSFVFATQFENRNKTIALPFNHFCDFLMRFSSFQIQIDARGANFASDCKFNRINPIFCEIFFQEHKLLSSPM
ncbi:MAG TPA: hypothetical protein PKW79_07280 [Rhabdochlamydiaceae bacterium]|nr:hypothetical protein [Rhabdochlamydiaceae bacterium]